MMSQMLRRLMLAGTPLLWPGAALAQTTTAPANDDSGSSDIVVTARKRSESVQRVPLSIRALDEKELLRLGADSLQGIAAQTPGLTLTGTRSATQIIMRGVTTGPVNHDQAEIKETVGLYLDETPISVQRYSPNLKLYDLERVEVLRGPQGTLYGAGSMAGAIRLITNKPATGTFAASVKGQIAGVDHGGTTGAFDAMVNIPLVTDVLAVRLVGGWRHNAGFIDNVATGDNNVNVEKTTSGRAAIRYAPGPDTTIDALVSYQRSNIKANTLYAEESGFLNTSIAKDEPYRDRNLITSLTINQSFEPFDVTAIGSYRRKRLRYFIEDGSFTNFVTGFRDGLGGIFDNYANQRDYSGEARIASKSTSPVQWTLGAFYQNSTNDFGQDFLVPGVDAVAGIDSTNYGTERDNLYRSRIRLHEKQFALFGEVVIPITEKLKLTAGGRYFKAKQNSVVDFAGIFSFPNIGVATFRHEEDGFNPRFNLAYEFDREHMFYAQAAKGFRLGGTNEPVPLPVCQQDLTDRGLSAAPTSFKSDSLWNYEVGTKNSFFNHVLTLNVSAYKIRWRNPQVTAQLGCGFNVFVNAGGLDITGGELEAIVQPMKGLTLRGGVGHTDSKLTENLTFVNGRKGDHAPYIPKWTFNGSIDYRRSITDALNGFAFLSYVNTGGRDTSFNTDLAANFRLRSYGVLNGRIGIETQRWSVELFAENLANTHGEVDKRYDPYPITAATFITPINPRTVGLEFTVRY